MQTAQQQIEQLQKLFNLYDRANVRLLQYYDLVYCYADSESQSDREKLLKMFANALDLNRGIARIRTIIKEKLQKLEQTFKEERNEQKFAND